MVISPTHFYKVAHRSANNDLIREKKMAAPAAL
jgi:hypothetical protein